jgi:hypothetical protein
MTRTIHLHRQPDGSFVDWGRHGPGREGPALHYTGEAAEVLRLVLAHVKPATASEIRAQRLGYVAAEAGCTRAEAQVSLTKVDGEEPGENRHV